MSDNVEMRPKMTSALSLVLLLAGGTAVGSSHGAPAGGLRGVVTRGPITLVCTIDVPCDEVAREAILVFSHAGKTTRAKTDRYGRYRIRLAPGRYRVAAARRYGMSIAPNVVRAPRGWFARVDFDIDTGIR